MEIKKKPGGQFGNTNGRGNKDKKKPPFSEEHKRKLSLKRRTEEEKKRLSEYWTGKKRPELSGKNHWNWKGGISANLYRVNVRRLGLTRAKDCDACGSGVRVVYDHDHKTGKFRGWLCNNCNVALGLLKDDIVKLVQLRKYLENYKTITLLGGLNETR
jgi:hypothetical protein